MQSGNETFGGYLGQLRKERGITLGFLAQQSGINKSTLSRWETGTSVPRLPEMTRVLEALCASSETRAKALRLLHVPRAILAERMGSLVPMRLSLGDLLFGLRQRAGLTQPEAARGVGVAQSLYSRWEGDGAQPTDSQIHAVCFALGASGEEAATLSARGFAHAPVAQDREAILERYTQTTPWEEGAAQSSHNLLFLGYLANFGRLYRMGKADIADIALMVANFGHNALNWGEDTAAANAYYARARVLAERSHESLHIHLVPAVIGMGSVASKASPSAILIWLPRLGDDASRAYLLSFLAKTMARHDPDAALRLADTYCALVSDIPSEHACRLRDKGNLLRLCGRPAESVSFLAPLEVQDRYREALKQLDIAHGLVALDAKTEAAACLAETKKILFSLGRTEMPSEVANMERLLN